ncbi:glycoside hydrolase family 76 protein [Atractiella rhizophila]|nr:glycoside hydrolase family 76 protein [Atractiella rhizophila]
MSTWLGSNNQYEWTAWWQNPVVGIAYADLDLAFGDEFNKEVITALLTSNDQGVSYMIDKYVDDQAWWGLFALKGYLLYGNEKWLQAATIIQRNSSEYWDDTCGGGVLWLTYQQGYKNTITNALYFSLLTRLYLLTGLPYYFTESQRVLEWWFSWAFEPSTAKVYDDMSAAPDCHLQNLQKYTYNSGSMLPGLVDLYHATGNETLLDVGRSIAYAGIRDFSTEGEGITREDCENDPAPSADLPPGCQQDPILFKGIFLAGMKDLYLARPDENILNYLNTQLLSATFNDLDSTWLYGQWWSGPWNETTAGPKTQICALSLLSAAISADVDFVKHYEANGHPPPQR